MKYIYLLIIILIAFTSGVLISKHHYSTGSKQLQEDFKQYGQFHPSFMNYTDDQMLAVCEQYELVYSYEKSECI